LSVDDVLTEIREHIDRTQSQHFKSQPDIAYHHPLCRLGYLYKHVPLNATVFEWVLRDSKLLKEKLQAAEDGNLHICAVGGGPGTEFLGLAKRLEKVTHGIPKKVSFSVLDNVPQWSETWDRLADAVDIRLRKGGKSPIIAPSFIPMDVLDKSSYKHYAFKFKSADIIVFNYLFSENKTRLSDAQAVLEHFAKVTPDGCQFVTIDRLERNSTFTDDLIEIFVNAGFAKPKSFTYDNSMDGDEQAAAVYGKDLIKKLGHPRVAFFTKLAHYPTVFRLVTHRNP
jgi:hypothetical protein